MSRPLGVLEARAVEAERDAAAIAKALRAREETEAARRAAAGTETARGR